MSTEVFDGSTDSIQNVPTRCPYLGRRHHPGEAYSYTSGHNVCYARPRGDGRSYSRVSTQTQVVVCLGRQPADWEGCRAFQKAIAASRPLPSTLPARRHSDQRSRGGRRKRRKERRERLAHLAQQALRILLIALFSWFLGLTVARLAQGG